VGSDNQNKVSKM